MQGLDDLYREVILDHYRTPHGSAPIDDVSVEVDGFNPLCGDELKLALKIANGRVESVHIEPSGCSLSVASASMLAQQLPGMSIDDAIALKETFKSVMRGESWPDGLDPGDLEALEGVKSFPVRIKCVLLAWMALEQALAEYDPALGGQVEADKDIEVRAS